MSISGNLAMCIFRVIQSGKNSYSDYEAFPGIVFALIPAALMGLLVAIIK